MNRDAIARALGALAQAVQVGDVLVVRRDSAVIIKRGVFGALPCIGITSDALLLKCIRRVISVRPPMVALHFRSVTMRRRDGSCFADLDGRDIRAYVVIVPGRPARVFIY